MSTDIPEHCQGMDPKSQRPEVQAEGSGQNISQAGDLHRIEIGWVQPDGGGTRL